MHNPRRVARRRRVLFALQDARALLARPYGWIKGRSSYPSVKTDNGFSYCMLGSIDAVTDHAAVRQVREMVRLALPEPEVQISTFNDRRETHKKDVLAVFDRAIALAKAEGK